MRAILTLLILACLYLSACHKPAEPQHQTVAPPSGSYTASEILLANGSFRPYRDDPARVMFDGDLVVRVHVPGIGEVEMDLEPVPPRYGFLRSWEGAHDATNMLKVNQDSYGRVFLTFGDNGEDGKSNAIGWRFDPWGRG
jgi:hypothetical protein